MQKIVEATPCGEYRLQLRFADGTRGEVDLADLAGVGVFAAWNDPPLSFAPCR
jgi:hypothetical protein